MDRLIKAKEKALANPIEFVEKLQMKEDMNLPQLQEIYSIPLVDWEKYSRNVNFASLTHKHMTRHKKSNATTSSVQPGIDNSSGQPAYEQRNESDDSAISVVRGRICNTGKSQTFNQLWTVEEQKKLEDLLVKYPPEEVEARRWEKIAKALINRTPQQVIVKYYYIEY